MKRILVTGAAGFIGYHYARRLCEVGHEVWGIDNLSDYYDVALKQARLKQLEPYDNFKFQKLDLADRGGMENLFRLWKPEIVVNLAAQAGVRYSLENPHAYIESNITGFTNVLEGCRHNGVEHLIFASSSSVYGSNTTLPFATEHNVDHPISLYAATKKSNELMAHTYAHLYRLPCTGLRFFTVYGPYGRPDMAMFKFTKALFEGKPIDVYNNGDMQRDFTYVDDITESMLRLLGHPAQPDTAWSSDAPDPSRSNAPYRLYNIGNNNPEDLMELIRILEQETGCTARMTMLPMQPGDVHSTYAQTDDLARDIGFSPDTDLRLGVKRFVEWYRDYHGIASVESPVCSTVTA